MPAPKERTTIKVQAERTVLAAVRLPASVFDERDPFGELASLTEQAGGIVVGTIEQRIDKPNAGTYMGKGKLQELKALCAALDAGAVIFDHELSPRQIANIEEVVERKVLDRSELILDIFASRATTTEAQLQVELAQLEYTYPRLRAMWSHLERIVGAGGLSGIGTRGPGEQQLEIDRRLAQRKQVVLRRRLAEIEERKRRTVAKRNLDHFTVGIVGYTNAGKSTLFNTLTEGGAYADDRLFATLTTRTRQWDLGGGFAAMLSDTVGFVRDLPHNLVASFRATLEEATHAHALLVVLDVSDPAAEMHFETVMKTLDELFEEQRAREHTRSRAKGIEGDEGWKPPPRIVLLNKADKLKNNGPLLVWQRRVAGSIPIVAKRAGGTGHAELVERIAELARGGEREVLVTLPLSAGRAVDMLEKRATVLERTYADDEAVFRVRIGSRQLDQLRSVEPRLRVGEVAAPAARARRARAGGRAPRARRGPAQ